MKFLKKIFSFTMIFIVFSVNVFASDVKIDMDGIGSYYVESDLIENEVEEMSVVAGGVSLGAFAKFMLDTALAGGALYSLKQTYDDLKGNRDALAELDYQIELMNKIDYQGVGTVDDLVALGVNRYTANKIQSEYKKYQSALANGENYVLTSDNAVNTKDLASIFGTKINIKNKNQGFVSIGDVSISGYVDSSTTNYYINNVLPLCNKKYYIVVMWAFQNDGEPITKSFNAAYFPKYDISYSNNLASKIVISGEYYSMYGNRSTSWNWNFDDYGVGVREGGTQSFPLGVQSRTSTRIIVDTNVPELQDSIGKNNIFSDSLSSSLTGSMGDYVTGGVADMPMAVPGSISIPAGAMGDLLADSWDDWLDKIYGGMNDGTITVGGAMTDTTTKDDVADDTQDKVEEDVNDKVNTSILDKISDLFSWFTSPATDEIDLDPLKVSFNDVFPFCIPFDFKNIFVQFSAEKSAPRFEFDFKKVNADVFSKTDPIVLDLSDSNFNEIIKIFRGFSLLLFVVFLIMKTRDIIKG